MTLRNLHWLAYVFFVVQAEAHIEVLHEWKYIDYVWKNSSQKQQAIDSGNYATNSCIPFDMDRAPDGRMFVTVARQKGVPASLATVSNQIGEGGPELSPYPDWSWHENEQRCEGIISVYRVAIKCNRLFVLDCGKIGDDKICPPQLLIFDLSTDKLIKRIEIPYSIAENINGTGLLVTPIVHPPRSCKTVEQSVVYMADVEGYGLAIWNGYTSELIRLESPSFEPDPNAERFTVNEDSFQIADGLLGMAITSDSFFRRNPLLYFRPLASYDMFYTKTNQLLQSSKNSIEYFKEPTKLKSQSAAQAFSNEGILFFSGMTETSILCWNRRKSFTPENIVTVLQNDELLQFASGLKIIDESMYVMTNRYQKVAANTIDFTDVNFRIIFGNVKNLVKGTNCEKKWALSFHLF